MQRQKSSEKIIRAFLSLLDQKNLEEIKILDITSVADVSKTTFYSNFENLRQSAGICCGEFAL